MLSWKAIILIALLVGLIVLSYMRESYKKTISILGAGQGWRTSLASAYPLFSYPLGFPDNSIAPAITHWMENGQQPKPQDAETIYNLIASNGCIPAQAWTYVKCNIPYDSGYNCHDESPSCSGSKPPASTGTSAISAFYQYVVPILGLGMMAL